VADLLRSKFERIHAPAVTLDPVAATAPSPDVLDKLKQAGHIAARARDLGARRIAAGERVRDVCVAVEDEIHALGGRLAFPVQSSRNHVAAHYCPSPDDESVYVDGDVAKLDVGVHLDGWVVDTAVTVSVGSREENRALIRAADEALRAAIAALVPGVEVRAVSAEIERAITSRGLRPVRNLCGHGVGHWTVHCAPPIPNVPDAGLARLPLHAVVAIEPFATDGIGMVREEGEAQVFRLPPERERPPAAGVDASVLAAIAAFRGLPFARRQLAALPARMVEDGLAALLGQGRLAAYPPLAETSGRRVAQSEHTVYLAPEGVVVLTE
jgi:methionyl aminopeptidase